jgi:hypothetical protein
MQKVLFVAAAVTAAILLGNHSSQAYYEGPWCAIVNTGEGAISERCHFRSFEACRMEVISGNRGTCTQNPRWPGYYASPSPRKRVHRKRVHRNRARR